jgi:hypothetical protein
MCYISITSLVFLLLIVLSDIKTRQIPIIYLLGETIASFCLGYNLIGTTIIKSTFINLAIISFQILILWGWIKIREGNSGNNLWLKFGEGDLFMLAILAINLSALNYLFFVILASLISIIIWVGFSRMRNFKNQTIPFAGFLAVETIILRILQMTGDGTNYYSDNYILNLIYGIYQST